MSLLKLSLIFLVLLLLLLQLLLPKGYRKGLRVYAGFSDLQQDPQNALYDQFIRRSWYVGETLYNMLRQSKHINFKLPLRVRTGKKSKLTSCRKRRSHAPLRPRRQSAGCLSG